MIRRSKKFLAVIFLLAGLIIWPYLLQGQEKTPEIGSLAPDFTLNCLGGKPHSLSDYKGKIVVLEWTNPNCPYVVRVYKTDGIIPALQRKYKEKGIIWITINSTHPEHKDYLPPEKLKEIYADWQASYSHYLMDPDGKVGRLYGAKTTPQILIINAEGKLVYNGALDDDPRGQKSKDQKINYVELALEALLEGKEIATPLTQPYGCTVKYK
ncbi:MAG: thioredoxin family protein [Candidatus Aminicenantes bacterium]|nr:thioredoxin family protein [Candidatus Aminicenantes bacterium]